MKKEKGEAGRKKVGKFLKKLEDLKLYNAAKMMKKLWEREVWEEVRFFVNALQTPKIRVNQLTPFGVSIDVSKVLSVAKKSYNWYEKALAFHTVVPEILSHLQSAREGKGALEIVDECLLLPRGYSQAIRILTFRHGFRCREYGNMLVPLRSIKNLFYECSSLECRPRYPPLSTQSVDRKSVKNVGIEEGIVRRALKEYARVETVGGCLCLYPLNPLLNVYSPKTFHRRDYYFVVSKGTVQRVSSFSKSEIPSEKLLEELRDFKERAFDRLYSELKA